MHTSILFSVRSFVRLPRAWVVACGLMLGAVTGVLSELAPMFAPAACAGETVGGFRVTIDPAVLPGPYTGRVYVALSTREGGGREPRQSMGDWGGETQVLSLDVKDLKAGEGAVLEAKNGSVLGFPKAFGEVPAGKYRVQAVARRSLDSCSPGRGEGDLYSDGVSVEFKSGEAGVVELQISKTVKARVFRESARAKLVEVESPSLSKFLGHSFKLKAGVMLPQGWKGDGSQKYSTLYFISGFGSDHHSVNGLGQMLSGGAGDTIIVIPDPTCYEGHSVFADSETNGPWGQAFTTELIPEIEKRFHGAATADRRFVSGISSGGWSSLWLQVAYPDVFGGCWSHCPDPVDFRDFQRIDLYAAGANMYRDAKGDRRPLARDGAKVNIWYDDFVRQETVMGPGGQIGSFEAVFSPRVDGRPRALFDRKTGVVDPVTAKAWEKYDIRLVLERNWKTLGPKLKGKLHIYAGSVDNFYLEGAAKLLEESLTKLGSDATVEVVDGMGHSIAPQGIQEMFEAIGKAGK